MLYLFSTTRNWLLCIKRRRKPTLANVGKIQRLKYKEKLIIDLGFIAFGVIE
jgi:hypothetical protein